MITPQACRRITGAVQALPDHTRRDLWGAWTQGARPNQVRTDMPYDIASIALDALVTAERRIEEQLGQSTLNEDERADLLNDLGYVQGIETALRGEGDGR
jgi:hypothetical protein